MKKLIDMIKRHEGYKKFPYHCSANKLTIGYGRNLDDVGISQYEAEFLLKEDIKKAYTDILYIFPDFYSYLQNRQIALIDMIYNLGKSRFALFKKMITAIIIDDWEEAAKQAKDSKWHNQVGNRAIEIEHLLMNG